MINFDKEILDINGFKYLLHNSENLSIWDHRIIGTSNVKVTLIELSIPAFGHDGLISSIDLSNVKPLNFGNVGVHGHEPTKGYSKIISKSTLLSPLIFKIIDEFGVFSIFSCKDMF